ncbi:MAG: segregation/condensation protein A [Candidatus Thiodiazotropha sp. (ex Dulcina madagascariensis)]|nr:segregation/condensation protein A [Candidatus Thiodiazotropha sp. (ex Epidulcina cf. delphinae)]MCU7924620.1 segregation/condensation protein A [Candidatus Thiodiazotropha sp. (ex Dulcina madagascariensis)]MCU7928454.1 segregation/condensation protein A [Candidatus Thiodiazotropha sp. (ex Dulcina madagascariensis)]MCU7936458.1 segregation/condensation protein A [Candidatus Thiodiazotropha sp. (ex Dulcina madagascariensis)]
MDQTEGHPHYHPEQEEMPFAVVLGEPLATPPTDLYIPPDALEVFLDAFEGPLDLLLYLIRRQNLDILDIPIAEITDQYVHYIEMMNELRLELAAEYLVMAAMLAEIKSRMLLPRPVSEEEEGDDPRAELIRRLQEYERYKQAAEDLDGLQHMTRDTFQGHAELVDRHVEAREPDVALREILLALQDVLHRADMFTSHRVEREALSVREKMSYVLQRANAEAFVSFTDLFVISEGRLGVVVTFLAVLELLKGALLELVQAEDFAPIHVKAKSS